LSLIVCCSMQFFNFSLTFVIVAWYAAWNKRGAIRKRQIRILVPQVCLVIITYCAEGGSKLSPMLSLDLGSY
jgi:hypothetical protein